MSKSQNMIKKVRFYQPDFCNRLKHARQSAGFDNQKSVAYELHVTIATISKWENGTSTPPLDSLVEMAALYGTTTDYLLTGTETEHVDASRKYGLSNGALNVLEWLNHNLYSHLDSLLNNILYDKLNKASSEKRKCRAIHALAFINSLVTSPDFPSIAIEFTRYIFNKNYLPSMHKAMEVDTSGLSPEDQLYERYQVNDIIDKIYTDHPSYANYRFEKSDPNERLSSDEYHLNKKWRQLFYSLLRDVDGNIIKNGIFHTDDLTIFGRNIGNEELKQLRQHSNEMEAQHEKGK